MGHGMRTVLSQGRGLLWPPGHHFLHAPVGAVLAGAGRGVSRRWHFRDLQYAWLPKQGRYTRMESFGPEEHI